ncbi:MAG: chemotaxis protein CheW [Cyanobacteria bacterium J06639_1]
MATLSSSRTRRSRSRTAEATRQVLTFKLQDEWFALPLEAVRKVSVLGDIYGDGNHSGISLTVFEGRELVVVDVARRIFSQSDIGSSQSNAAGAIASNNSTAPSFLIVVSNSEDNWVGLPTQTPPAVRRIPASAFTPLPETYRAAGTIQYVSSLAVQTEGEPPMFVLDRDRLIAGTLATV